MLTGTAHAGGPQPTDNMSLAEFVLGPLASLSRFKAHPMASRDGYVGVRGNEHFLPAMAQCNFGLSSVSADAPTWDVVGTSGYNQADTFRRVTAFLRRVFGSGIYDSAARDGWCSCTGWSRDSKCTEPKAFFSPHTSKGEANARAFEPTLTAKIDELYRDDVAFYRLSQTLRDPDGSAPGDLGCT